MGILDDTLSDAGRPLPRLTVRRAPKPQMRNRIRP
jgi:hypothetical protein